MPSDHNEQRAGFHLLARSQAAMFSLMAKDEGVETQHPKVTFCQGTEVIHTGQQKGHLLSAIGLQRSPRINHGQVWA